MSGTPNDSTLLGLQLDTSALIETLADRIVQRLQDTAKRALYSPREAASSIGISESKFYGLMRAGLPTIKIGGQQRVDLAEAIAWLREHGASWQDEGLKPSRETERSHRRKVAP